ncbi:spectrin beta chain, non-erythrocytic 5 isoform X3 [Denticeps clupeoides]|uniref:spectrin beta chain, non-erythrocytic 5 isoform X3 n=1 Tax=Denticeps clupeoides TaxID=299321 RepID=UPI0010A47271|nr:spectrin beta chain, non-erythrocytic 5-like isoform X3 [Denticeps clupeoides]
MSDSIVRKIQPFTIGTRLSVPSVAKCPDFSDSCFSSQTLDNCKLQHNLNDHVSLFLSRAQARTANLKLGPQSPPRTPAMQPPQQVPAEEDHLNKNAVSPTATARSIRKITISGSTEGTEETDSNGPGAPRVTATPNTVNNNNNNNIITTGTQLPRIVGVSSGNKLSSHLKAPVFKALLLKKDLLKAEGPSCEKKEASVGYKGVVTQSEVPLTEELFNQEVTQAEAWIKGKLQDLKDGCSFQRCPLKDWEEKSQALQRDLKDFENTLIQLNQTGEQLMSKLNPTSDMVRKQLSQLRDQWHTLKQTAASQSKALGGAKNLQEFNLKVERLEAWVKEKQEEEQALAHLLGENMDKMQLTRRILDLKQDEQLYRNLHEEINDLALKLEKQGKVEGRNISTRRKHVNKIWLKVQSALKDYHKKLQVALEMSSFYQQADSILSVVDSMRKSLGQESCGDGEIRDVASQIMMLDVTVSQLSNLHPVLAARVTQKQGEVKEHWALLQKAFRNEKPTLPLPTPQFTREDGDPVTPQSGVGMDPQRMLGKEVKEEQNRLQGCSSERKRAAATSNLQQEHDSQNDITAGHQTDDESMSVRAEVKTRVSPQGHPLLHIQLQKFTVSADKTLSWLKNNVAMATEIGYTTGLNFNYEAAKRCQAALEQDILGNRARIELVKKEGRSLIRAQHPGSAKIEEFLGQLEVLWEELKRHYQRNVVVLQSSEEVNIRAQRVLQTLNSLEAWLEATGLYARQAFLAGDPESMSMAERESSLMEREMSARNLELQSLRQEVETLCTQKHLYTELLPTRIQDVEKKYDKVRAALSQQSSKLQDTRMLAEFLERVELEEEHHYCTLGQPLHSETDSEPSVLAGGASVPLMPSIGDPVEELREAVEMLNDTVRERGRSVPHDRAVQELLSRHASVAQRVEQQVKRCTQLATDVLESENEMAVRCEPERSGLDALQDRNNQLEADYKELKKEAEALENLAAQLEKLCPERLHVLWHEVQVTLQGWRELRKAMEENRVHLLQFRQLRDFFRIYLDMISWTEDTRSCIFSDSAMHYGKPMAEVLDLQIEQKFEEFEELAKAGKKLISAEHPLTKMIKERMEELRSMLGWILVHWRAQKLQWKNKMRMSEAKEEDAIYSEAMVYSSAAQLKIADATQKSCPCPGFDRSDAGSIAAQSTPWSPGPKITSPPCGVEDLKSEDLQLESGYEVMGSITPSKGSDVTSRADSSRFPPFLMLNEPSTHSVGGTVNLILSFNSSQHSPMPCPKSESDEVEGGLEPIHRDPSLLSLHMGIDRDHQRERTSGVDCNCTEEQAMSIRGHCFSTHGKKLNFPSMEGTLERKQKLQFGGKKAQCRTWTRYHAVLHRQTLCFYQERKETLGSFASSLPLTLTGAECVALPEYTKKPNCFSLRLRDGSEVLLSASSRFMMKKWMLRIQENAVSEQILSILYSPTTQDEPLDMKSFSTVCHCQGKCKCASNNDVATCSTSSAQTGIRTKKIVVLPRDSALLPQTLDKQAVDVPAGQTSHAGRCEDNSSGSNGNLSIQCPGGITCHSPCSSPTNSQEWVGSSKRRSHSFTSATYQRIKPVPLPSAGMSQDSSSKYSVTLFIGDQTSEVPRLIGTTGQEPMASLPLRSCASLPRPRNKSVFKKFFAKKE